MKIPSKSRTSAAGTTEYKRYRATIKHLRTAIRNRQAALTPALSLRHWVLGLSLLMALVGYSGTTLAGKKLSAEEVRSLIAEGKVRSLMELIAQHQFEGHLLDAELERDHGRLVYELEYLTDKGEVWEYELDAQSGEILEKEREE